MFLIVNTIALIKKWINWALPATGSKITIYQCTLASGSYTNLVHNGGGSAITGKGELVALIVQNTTPTATTELEKIETTVDGGTLQETTSLSIWPNGSSDASQKTPAFTIPCNLPFNSSLLVRVDGDGTGAICYAVVRTVI